MNDHALEVAQKMHKMVSYADGGRLTPGQAERIAQDIQNLAVSIKPAFRRANMVAEVELVEALARDLQKPRSDKLSVLTRLQSAVYGVYMRAHSLAHPQQE